jgi:ABC-type transport system involved in multi-copper enzyme maturation permease subunit
MNPVLGREIKERFRRRWAPAFLILWLVIVAVLAYFGYVLGRSWLSNSFSMGFVGTLGAAGLGRFMFEILALVLLTAVLFVVPGIAALAIVGERERLTLPLLQVSQLTPGQIVRGKLVSSLAYLALLIVAVAPILVLPILIGGVTLADSLVALLMIAVTALMLGSLSLLVSARARSVRGAVGAAYLWSFVFAVLTTVGLVGETLLLRPSELDTFGPTGRELYTAWPNPYIGLVSIVDEPIRSRSAVSFATPFRAIDELLIRRQAGRQGENFNDIVFDGRGGVAVDAPVAFLGDGDVAQVVSELPRNRGPVWHRTVVLYLLITAVSLWAAARHVSVPRRKLVRRRHRVPVDEGVPDAA